MGVTMAARAAAGVATKIVGSPTAPRKLPDGISRRRTRRQAQSPPNQGEGEINDKPSRHPRHWSFMIWGFRKRVGHFRVGLKYFKSGGA